MVNSRVEDFQLPETGSGGVVAIVSEWMGHGLLFENMLPSVLVARDRFLRPSAEMEEQELVRWRRQRLFPCEATLFIAGFCDAVEDGGEEEEEEEEEGAKHWEELSELYQVSILPAAEFCWGCFILATEVLMHKLVCGRCDGSQPNR